MSWLSEAIKFGVFPPFRAKDVAPRSQLIACFGHSWMANNSSASTRVYYARGILSQAMTYGNGAWWFLPAVNGGTSGDKTSDMVARLPAFIATCKALGVARVLVSGFANDIAGGVATSTSIANMAIILDAFAAADIAVDLIVEAPRNDAGMDSTRRAKLHYFQQWARQQRVTRSPRLFALVPVNDWVTDRGNSNGDPIALVFSDGLHPSDYGAAFIGQKLAAYYNAIFPRGVRPIVSRGDAYDATYNLFGALKTGGVPNGTGGTKGTGASGSVPDGWTMQRSSGSALTASGAVNALTDDTGGYAFDVTLAGTGGVVSEVMRITPFTSLTVPAGLPVGQKIAFEVEIEHTNLANWSGIMAQFVSSVAGTYQAMATSGVGSDRLLANGRRILRPPPIAITNPGTETVSFDLFAYADCSGAGPSGTLRVYGASIRAVAA